jgi:hypothetical protein
MIGGEFNMKWEKIGHTKSKKEAERLLKQVALLNTVREVKLDSIGQKFQVSALFK